MSLKTKQGPIIAIVLSVALVAYILLGSQQASVAPQATDPLADDAALSAPSTAQQPLPKVQVQQFREKPVTRYLDFDGETLPSRDITLRAQASGQVIDLVFSKGQSVKKGDIIARIDPGDLQARLNQALALQKQRQLEYEGIQQLLQKGLQNKTSEAAVYAQYEQARAEVFSLELQLAYTQVRAPFSGVLNALPIEIGSYVRAGDAVAQLLDFSTVRIHINVSEKHIDALRNGMPAEVTLIGGQRAQGVVSFVSSQANASTRTFLAEITLDSSNIRQPIAGASADVSVRLDSQLAYFISPALLALDHSGQLGLKTVNRQNKVEFTPVDIIRSEPEGVWISGLEPLSRTITVGQGFVSVGDTVIQVIDEATANSAAETL